MELQYLSLRGIFILFLTNKPNIMKKILTLVFVMAGLQAYAQSPIAGILNRFTDPEKGHVVFIEKGSRALGIKGSYSYFNADGYVSGDGYSILSLLNVGDSHLNIWSVTPKFSWFVADDVSLGINLEYSGYHADTDINLDFRELVPKLYEWLDGESEIANVSLSSRHMVHHSGGLGFSARKYLSFFGSRTLGIFGEGRFFAKYGNTFSSPRDETSLGKTRISQTAQVGVQIAAGVALRLKDNSAITVSVPIFGVAWNGSWQDQTRRYKTAYDADGNKVVDGAGNPVYHVVEVPGGGRLSYVNAARKVDFLGVQIAYNHFIQPKKRK